MNTLMPLLWFVFMKQKHLRRNNAENFNFAFSLNEGENIFLEKKNQRNSSKGIYAWVKNIYI